MKNNLSSRYDNDNAIPSSILNSYEVFSCLKHTVTKQVYILTDKANNQKKILKCASGQAATVLETEYQFLSAHSFPFLPKAFYGEWMDSSFYLIREYFEGETLEDYVEKRETLTCNEALSIITEISFTIETLHKQNPPILHRDIKPQNFMRTWDGKYVIIDMETAKSYHEDSDCDTVIIGTKQTAAPEQFGYHQSSIQTDIYGLGILLIYLLTGSYSLKQENLTKIPWTLRKIILKCTAFAPDKRYKNIASFRKDLHCCQTYKMRTPMFRTIIAILIAGLLIGGSVLTAHLLSHVSSAEKPVSFVNPKIEAAARHYLHVDDTTQIYPDDLARIKTMLITGDMFLTNWHVHEEYHGNNWYEFGAMEAPDVPFPLDDLQYFTGLENLALDLQNVEDLSGLKGLPLKKISLMRNQITDVSVLGTLESLEYIRLNNNPVESVDGFEQLTNLKYLYLMNTDVDDLTPIQHCPLKELNYAYAHVRDLQMLTNLTSLNNLVISHLSAENIQHINTLTSLQKLTLIDCEIKSLREISNLKKLINLDVSGCVWLESLEGIETFDKLEYLAISSTHISDISPLRNLPRLNCLEPSYAPISDFTPLLSCPEFNNMFIDRELAEIAQRDLADKMVTYNIID